MRYVPEDFRYDTPPRVMGSESEYNLAHVPPETTAELTLGDFVPLEFRALPDEISEQVWLVNGGVVSRDGEGLIEFSTPETTSSEQVANHEQAGEELISTVASLIAAKVGATPGAYKRSGYAYFGPTSYAVTAGHHESYFSYVPFADKSPQARFSRTALYSFLMSRPIWAGAGIVTQSGYGIHQKTTPVIFAMKSAEYEDSKLACLYHPHANRLELRTGDGNMSRRMIELKYAMTSLVLRLIEHDQFPQEAIIDTAQPTRFYADIRENPFSKYRPLGDRTLAEHQTLIAQHALSFAEQQPYIPESELAAAKETLAICAHLSSDMEPDTLAPVDGVVDWAAKLNHMREKGIDPSDPELFRHHPSFMRARYYDLLWEDVGSKGISRRWYGKKGNTGPREGVEAAKLLPPSTRAFQRTQALEGLSRSAVAGLETVSWDTISVNPGLSPTDARTIHMPDPYETGL